MFKRTHQSADPLRRQRHRDTCWQRPDGYLGPIGGRWQVEDDSSAMRGSAEGPSGARRLHGKAEGPYRLAAQALGVPVRGRSPARGRKEALGRHGRGPSDAEPLRADSRPRWRSSPAPGDGNRQREGRAELDAFSERIVARRTRPGADRARLHDRCTAENVSTRARLARSSGNGACRAGAAPQRALTALSKPNGRARRPSRDRPGIHIGGISERRRQPASRASVARSPIESTRLSRVAAFRSRWSGYILSRLRGVDETRQ